MCSPSICARKGGDRDCPDAAGLGGAEHEVTVYVAGGTVHGDGGAGGSWAGYPIVGWKGNLS